MSKDRTVSRAQVIHVLDKTATFSKKARVSFLDLQVRCEELSATLRDAPDPLTPTQVQVIGVLIKQWMDTIGKLLAEEL